MRPTTLLFFGSLVIVHGHFLLTYPPTIGFDNDNEGEAPCGGFPDIFNNLTAPSMNITVAGFPIELQSTHPQAAWLFRATLSHEAPFNWTNLLPVVSETGIGDFCVPDLGAPVEFAGHAGILQVVQEEEGELLYQCALVNFVSGRNSSTNSTCTNAAGLTATLTGNTTLNGISEGNSSTTTSSLSSRTAAPNASGISGTKASSMSKPTTSSKSGAGRVAGACMVLGLTALAFAVCL